MFCPSCGTQNERDSEKCKNCGKLLPKLSPAGDLVMPPTEDMTGTNPDQAPAESVTPGPGAPGPKAGSPGSQYSFTPAQQPGPPYYGPSYAPYGCPPPG